MSTKSEGLLPEKQGFYIPSLDGIRAIAIAIVFLGHVGLGKFVPTRFGVTIFFFLSGYLITTLLRREYDRHQKNNLENFYLSRVLRILPPFYLVLFTTIWLSALGVLRSGFTLEGGVAQIVHLANYWSVWYNEAGLVPGTVVLWSLAVEEHFYLLFPLLYIGLRKWQLTNRQQAFFLLRLCALALLWRYILISGFHASEDRIFFASDTRFDSILFGCVLGVYGNPMFDPIPFSAKQWQRFLFPLSLTVLVMTFLPAPFVFRETIRYTIQGLALYAVFITAILYPEWRGVRWLNHPWLKWLGKLSYSFYLTHFIIWFGLEYNWPTLPIVLRIGFTLILSLAVSYGIYRFVEQPCATLKQQLKQRRLPTSVPPNNA